MDFAAMAEKLMAEAQGDSLRRLTESETGTRLAARFDGASVEAAAKRGDTAELTRLLGSILSTAEGRQFAEQVRRTMGGHGR